MLSNYNVKSPLQHYNRSQVKPVSMLTTMDMLDYLVTSESHIDILTSAINGGHFTLSKGSLLYEMTFA